MSYPGLVLMNFMFGVANLAAIVYDIAVDLNPAFVVLNVFAACVSFFAAFVIASE